jgi:TolB-like protein
MPTSKLSEPTVRFGLFEVNLDTGEIRKRGRKIRLQEKPFKILVALLGRPGQVITREELRTKLWQADTFVDFDNGLNTAVNKIREALGDSAENPRFIETLARRGYRFIAPVSFSKTSLKSLAVLPLVNLSSDPGDEYFAEGMTEALISHLARIKSPKIISRTSAMRYKDSQKRLPEIARELGVEAVLEGSLQHVEDSVRVSVKLIEASTDRHIWAESYERKLRGMLALQGEIAQGIAHEIKTTLAPEERSPKAVDPQAYKDYLQGRYFLNRRAPDNIAKAIEYFSKAIAQIDDFAPAYSSLAEAFLWRTIYANALAADDYSMAKRNAQRALELDDSLSAASLRYVRLSQISVRIRSERGRSGI